MVRTDRTLKADIIKRQHNFVHIKGTIARKMCGFLEVCGRVEFQVADVRKVNSSLQGTNHIGQIIFKVGAIGSGAEGNAVVWVVNHLHHTQNVCFVDDDTGQSEHAPCGVIRMNCHVDIILVTDRHDAFQKVFQVCK